MLPEILPYTSITVSNTCHFQSVFPTPIHTIFPQENKLTSCQTILYAQRQGMAGEGDRKLS